MRVVPATFLLAIIFLAGCALQTRSGDQGDSTMKVWRGRLATRVEAMQVQAFAAEFELTGAPGAGSLTLYGPLGSTMAAISWSPLTAVMRSYGEERHFESLDTLITQTFGTEVPVTALFAWIAGEPMEAAGWIADLSQYGAGRILARRVQPAPAAELRLVLEK